MESNYIPQEYIKLHLADIKKGKLIIPYKVQLNCQGYCNNNCLFCSYRNAGWEKEGMEFRKPSWVIDGKEKVIDGVSGWSERVSINICENINELGIKETELTGGGEAMCHPHIFKMFKILNQGNSKITLVTNGTNLKKVVPYITNKWDWIRLSINAGTRETYNKVHKLDVFDNVMDSLNYVKSQTNIPIYISYCVVRENMHEIVKFTELMHDIGVNGVKFNAVYTTERDGRLDSYEADCVKKEIEKAMEFQDNNFKVMNSFWKRDKFGENVDFKKCWFQHFMVNIAPDGLVYPCCVTSTRTAYSYGNIYNNSLKEILYSKERKKMIKFYNSKTCPPCWLRDFQKNVQNM